jgi:hypothetical protein
MDPATIYSGKALTEAPASYLDFTWQFIAKTTAAMARLLAHSWSHASVAWSRCPSWSSRR